MHAIQIQEFGGAEQLKYEELPKPEPKAGEVRVKVAATGLNFVEIYYRKGLYSNSLPFVPGDEFAGTVDQVGEGVTEFKAGDRVGTVGGKGGYAEYALVPASKLVPVPEEISLEAAAAVLLQGMTAHYLAFSTYPLKLGDTALIHAAGGGVGQLLVQIAKKCGARVIGTASTEEKIRLARQAGADEMINYTQQDFVNETKRLTNDQGVNVVYDGVGQATFMKDLDVLKIRGYLVLFGQASGPVEPVNPQKLNRKGSLFLTRPTLAHYTHTQEELLWRASELFNWMLTGALHVTIDRTFPLREAAAAQTYMEDRKTKGKVLLIP